MISLDTIIFSLCGVEFYYFPFCKYFPSKEREKINKVMNILSVKVYASWNNIKLITFYFSSKTEKSCFLMENLN